MSDLGFILVKLLIAFVIMNITLVIAMYSTLAERKLSAFMQDRIGPNRAGPFGILQPLADGVKFFMKEEFFPAGADKFLFFIAPAIAITTAMMVSAVIPWGGDLVINGNIIPLQVTDLNVGLLYVFGVVSLSVYGIMIGGWASNNKYSLLGALRASSQIISYELSMGFAIIGLLMITNTLSLREITDLQAHKLFGISGFNWNIFYQPLGFIIFIVCAFAETNRAPFDLSECEAELVGGYHTEYSSMKLGLFLFAEYIHMFTASAMISILYFGGFTFPFMNQLGIENQNILTILGVVALFTKIFIWIFIFIWVRWTLPRFRYDQLMRLGWQVFIPLALFNILITGLVKLVIQQWF